MTELLIRPDPTAEGWLDVVPEGRLTHLAFALLRLRGGQEITRDTGHREHLAVLIHGEADIRCDDVEWSGVGPRQSVFTERAHAAYLPPGRTVTFRARTDLLVALPSSPAEGHHDAFLISPADGVSHRRGGPGFTRDVYDILGPDQPAERLLVGETINHPGNWSGFPPHRHDRHDPPHEAELEELYLFRIDPATGFAFMGLYTEERDLDLSVAVGDGDVFLIPRGYHPVAAPPGRAVYYLWVLAGRGRAIHFRTDPAYLDLLTEV